MSIIRCTRRSQYSCRKARGFSRTEYRSPYTDEEIDSAGTCIGHGGASGKSENGNREYGSGRCFIIITECGGVENSCYGEPTGQGGRCEKAETCASGVRLGEEEVREDIPL